MVEISYTNFSLYLGLYDREFTHTPEYVALNTHVLIETL